MTPLNLFYQEPDPDRWLPYDRYPRSLVRRLVRGPYRPGGQARVFLNLCAGLDKLGQPYRVNDFRHAKRNPDELACIVGKPFLLFKERWENPILFGSAVYSHPSEYPELANDARIRRILVPGDWMRTMFAPTWGGRVQSWPVGIDTDGWRPDPTVQKDIDVLIYDKVRWEHDEHEGSMLTPIRSHLGALGLTTSELRYGSYREADFHGMLARAKCMVFLCEHETQGIAYQQALSSGVPIFAWDRQGLWKDPSFYPDKAVFGPVTSVPYWDERCGRRFSDTDAFLEGWSAFFEKVRSSLFQPRDYILENLTLETCAQRYVESAGACIKS